MIVHIGNARNAQIKVMRKRSMCKCLAERDARWLEDVLGNIAQKVAFEPKD